jgi:DNA-binding transcriptional ArsR family regulator
MGIARKMTGFQLQSTQTVLNKKSGMIKTIRRRPVDELKGGTPMRERIVVSDARTASVFSSMRQRRLLLELVARESSLQEIAHKVQLPLNLVHYHMARMLELGLVEVTREQPRSGRVIKHYRASARSFFVPAHLISRSPGKELATELRASLDVHHDPREGTLYFIDDELSPRMRRMQNPTSVPDAIEHWHQLVLTKDEARLLANELKALLTRFEGRTSGRARSYLAYCALAPRTTQRKQIKT